MRVCVTTLTILRHTKEAHSPCPETPYVALGTGDLPVMLRQREVRNLVFERIAATDGLPVDDGRHATLVLGVTLDATLTPKGHVQTTRMQRGAVTG